MKRQECPLFLALAMSLVGLAAPLHGQFEFVYAYTSLPSFGSNVVNGYSVNFDTGAPTLVPGSLAGGTKHNIDRGEPWGKVLVHGRTPLISG